MACDKIKNCGHKNRYCESVISNNVCTYRNLKGAGRKPLPPEEKKVTFCVYWKPELIAKLDAMEGSRSVILERAFKNVCKEATK